MAAHRPIWIDHGNPVIRRGLAVCLRAAGYPVAGLSAGLVPRPDLRRTGVLLFDIDGAAADQVATLVRGSDVRLVGLLGDRGPEQLRHLRRAGVSAVLAVRGLTPERLLGLLKALEERGSPPPSGPRDGTIAGPVEQQLTAREFDVLRLLADGATKRDIAELLNYSERTVKNIVHDLLVKLRTRTRAHAVAVAARRGVI